MLALTAPQLAALANRAVMRRLFIYCEAKDFDGNPAPVGFWDDVGTVVVSGRTYHGAGNVVQVATLGAKGNLTIPSLTITLSGIASEAALLVRGEVIGQAPISVSLGIFDIELRTLIGALVPRFRGFVDQVDIRTPPAGDTSSITLTCESISRALTIKGTGTRSPATQNTRDANDRFYDYAAAQREQTLYFGRRAPLAQGSSSSTRGSGPNGE